MSVLFSQEPPARAERAFVCRLPPPRVRHARRREGDHVDVYEDHSHAAVGAK